MKTRLLLEIILWICILSTPLKAQKPERPTPFEPHKTIEQKHFPPVPFPEQNLNPDTTVVSEQGVKSNGELTSSLPLDAAQVIPSSQIMEAHPSAALPSGDIADPFSSRVFSGMTVVPDVMAYPASTAVHMFVSWPSNAGQCSGILIDAKHVLTAGHCVYDTDTDEWATSITVSPAYEEGPNPFYGTSDIGLMISWSGWVENANWEHDIAVIELARPVGALAGWCGYGYNNANSYFTGNTFHNYSYPGDPPYDGEIMYYRSGNFDTPQTYILYHNNDSWGGQSGSGAPDGNEVAYSALSHSYTNGSATGHTRLTSTKFTDIQNFIDDNTPDETDFVTLRAEASHNDIPAGAWLSYMNFLLYNNSSQAYSGNIVVDYYLSTDDYIGAGGDILLATYSEWVDLEGKGSQWILNDVQAQIPSDVTPGEYYIGMHVTNSDYYSLNNYTDYQDAFPITILCSQPETPELNFSGFVTKCDGSALYLEALNICDDCEVYWSTGDEGPAIFVDDAGVYSAVYVNPCGNVSEASANVIVDEIPLPEMAVVEAIGPTTFCEEDYVELTVDNVCPGCTVYWSTGDIGESILVFEPGYYTAVMTNICGDGAASVPVEVIVEYAPPPTVIVAEGSTTLCSGESVTLNAGSVCDQCDVIWSNGQQGPEITVSTAGTYTATVVNECGNSLPSNSITVSLMADPAAPQISANGPTQLCAGQSVNLVATNVCQGCSVTWSNGQTGTSIQVSAGGTYTAIVSNACGDSQASNSIPVTIENLPPAATITASGAPQLCDGQSLVLNVTNSCSGCTVQWSNGLQGNAITVTSAGTYTATMSNVCGQGPVSNSIVVTAAPPFIPVVQVNNTCHLAAPNGTAFQWLLNGQEIPNATTQFWTATEEGYYTVHMTGPDGCEGVSNPIFVSPCATAVIDPVLSQGLRIYPNPASEKIFLEWKATQTLTDVSVKLYTLQGVLVDQVWQSDNLQSGSLVEIALPSVPSGVYFYTLISREIQTPGYLVIER